jgi:hypothetical protein
MIMKILTLMTAAMIVSSFSFGQSRISLGVQGGINRLNANSSPHVNELPGFSPASPWSGVGQVYLQYSFQKDWFARLGFGVMNLQLASWLEGTRGNAFNLGGQTLNPQVISTFGKAFEIKESGWGVYLAGGLSVTKITIEGPRIYSRLSEDGIRTNGVWIRNEQGVVSQVLAHDMRVYNTTKNSLWHLRPEIGFFKQMGRSKISAAFIYGFNISEELYTVSYNSISYFGERYTEGHSATGSFISYQLGYEFNF